MPDFDHPAALSAAKGDDPSILRQRLERINLELSDLQAQQQRQLQELAELEREQQHFQEQQDALAKKVHLAQQVKDMEDTLREKNEDNKFALKDLEESKSHLHQLKRTLALMKGGVIEIIQRSQSAQDVGENPVEGHQVLREQLLQEIVPDDLKGSLLQISVPAKTIDPYSEEEDIVSEDEEIIENDEDQVSVSILSSSVGNISIGANRSSSNRRPKNLGRTHSYPSARSSRSETSDSRNLRTMELSTRSAASSRHSHEGSVSSSRRRRRRGKGSSSNRSRGPGGTKDQSAKSKKTSALTAMLEQHDDNVSEDSQDTPKTTNTRD